MRWIALLFLTAPATGCGDKATATCTAELSDLVSDIARRVRPMLSARVVGVSVRGDRANATLDGTRGLGTDPAPWRRR
jgi:hypothetical protein